MHQPARPATALVPAAPGPTATAHHASATAPRPAATPARATADEESEEASEARRDFYAWCAGCEGYGSIF